MCAERAETAAGQAFGLGCSQNPSKESPDGRRQSCRECAPHPAAAFFPSSVPSQPRGSFWACPAVTRVRADKPDYATLSLKSHERLWDVRFLPFSGCSAAASSSVALRFCRLVALPPASKATLQSGSALRFLNHHRLGLGLDPMSRSCAAVWGNDIPAPSLHPGSFSLQMKEHFGDPIGDAVTFVSEVVRAEC